MFEINQMWSALWKGSWIEQEHRRYLVGRFTSDTRAKNNHCCTCLLFVHECQQQLGPMIRDQPSSELPADIWQTHQITALSNSLGMSITNYKKRFWMIIILIISGLQLSMLSWDLQGQRCQWHLKPTCFLLLFVTYETLCLMDCVLHAQFFIWT